jgi:hypothetical protein
MQLDVMFGGSTYWSFDEAKQVATDGLPFDRLGAAAWDHPLYVMMAQGFIALPFAEPLYAINLMSAFFGVLAIAIVFTINLDLVGNPWIALLGSLTLAVAHTFWFHSVTSENYTLHLFFMSLLILLALRWARDQQVANLALFMSIAGLGLANHIMLALTVAPLFIFLIVITPVPGIPNRLRCCTQTVWDLRLNWCSFIYFVGCSWTGAPGGSSSFAWHVVSASP